ncbi:hypothetical protein P3342_010050 [Pyrenophora teres f. teres]|nr:hypothetical protein P3342_010050 [Pyrenophora teres f. teres]
MVGSFLVSSFNLSQGPWLLTRNQKTSHPPKERPRSPTVKVHVQTTHCFIRCSHKDPLSYPPTITANSGKGRPIMPGRLYAFREASKDGGEPQNENIQEKKSRLAIMDT